VKVERVRVGEVLALRRREVAIDPEAEYRLVGIFSFGKGIFHRDPKPGAELGDYRFFAIRPGDLVLSNIQAWEGAIAYATERDAGTIGTHRFLSYVPKDDRIDAAWARWFFLSEPGMELIRRAAPGTTVRNRTLAIERFESLEIPLPSEHSQREATQWLDRIHRTMIEFEPICKRSATRANALLQSWLEDRLARIKPIAVLGEVAEVHRGRGPRYEPGTGCTAINQACVRWGGIDLAQAREVERSWWEASPATAVVQLDDVLVNSTGEGTIGRAAVAETAAVGKPIDSHVMIVRACTDRLLPKFLEAYLRSPSGQDQINRAKGANTTKQTELGKAKLERFIIPAPTVQDQTAFIRDYEKILAAVGSVRSLLGHRERALGAVPRAVLNAVFASIK
jgi:type I restriction enzyme, S subunit